MWDYLNETMEWPLGDILFGDDPTSGDFKPYVTDLTDDEQDLLVATINEFLIVEANDQ